MIVGRWYLEVNVSHIYLDHLKTVLHIIVIYKQKNNTRSNHKHIACFSWDSGSPRLVWCVTSAAFFFFFPCNLHGRLRFRIRIEKYWIKCLAIWTAVLSVRQMVVKSHIHCCLLREGVILKHSSLCEWRDTRLLCRYLRSKLYWEEADVLRLSCAVSSSW